MGNRLSKIYTRTGDGGTTGLGDGSRTSKDSARIEALGTVDELNCCIGVLITHDLPDHLLDCLLAIQHTLFDVGGELSIPGFSLVKSDRVDFLEQTLDQLNEYLEPLKEFILPGGTAASAQCHVARAVCRRAERRLSTLASEEEISDVSKKYLNRLSDLLFVMARYINKEAGGMDILWNHKRKKRQKTQHKPSH